MVGVSLVPPLPLCISCYRPAGRFGGISSAGEVMCVGWGRGHNSWKAKSGGTPVLHSGRPTSCPPDLPNYSPLFLSSRLRVPGSLPQPCSAAFHVLGTLSGSHIPRSTAQRTAAATCLPSPSNPIVAPQAGVASFQCLGPCAGSPERLPGPARGFGDRGGAPGSTRSRAPTPTQ